MSSGQQPARPEPAGPESAGHARRWVRRVLVAAVVATAVVWVTTLLHLDPEPVRVVLLCALLVAGCGLLADGLPRPGARWYPEPTHPPLHAGRDESTRSHVRLLEDHGRTRHPDALLRDRLDALADQVLVVRHGVHSRTPRGRELLGPELVEVLHGPVVRLDPRRIDRVLHQIEEL